MRYWYTKSDGFIVTVGTGNGGEEITEAEYNEIMSAIQSKPAATQTTGYRLKTDLTWEAYEIEPPDPDPDIDEAEAWEIVFGGAE